MVKFQPLSLYSISFTQFINGNIVKVNQKESCKANIPAFIHLLFLLNSPMETFHFADINK